jgi:hypothetical protein
MTRLYESRGFAVRMNISCVIIVGAAAFGCFELLQAYRFPEAASSNLLFALLFFVGAAYSVKQIRDGAIDNVVSFDADMATRQSAVTLWRPFSRKTIAGPVDRLTDWQFQVRSGRVRTPILTAHHPDYPRPLEFELRPGAAIHEELRKLAPDAVAAFERKAAEHRAA